MATRFGEYLAEARKAKKITLRKLGQLIGLSPSFLSELETGRRLPPKDEEKLRDLALILNIDQKAFLKTAEIERVRKDPKVPVMIGEVLAGVVARADAELYAKQESELEQFFYWRWEEGLSVEWNTYKFSDLLEIYKRACLRWEEKHNGCCCVVERVRDKYVMPKVREFLAELARHNHLLTR